MSSDEPRVFLSYSRKDQDFAQSQRDRIASTGLSLWQDVTHMQGGNAGQWWDQIKDTLEQPSTEHILLFVSDASLASKTVGDEWRLARRNGVEAHLVKVSENLTAKSLAEMPAFLSAQHFYNLNITEQFNYLISVLHGPPRQLRVPAMVPRHNHDFVPRIREAEQITTALTSAPIDREAQLGHAVGISAALKGSGGYGKTQLARWICQQERIVDHFYDGILWVELGENPDAADGLQRSVEYLIAQLCRSLTDRDRGFRNAHDAAQRLFHLLEKGSSGGKGHYLLVIDDVWRESDVALFMGGAPNTTRLFTTRITDILPVHMTRICVEEMEPAEARAVLSSGLEPLGIPNPEIDANQNSISKISTRLGYWALLLSLANAQIRNEVELGASLEQAIAFIVRIYDEMGITAFDAEEETQRSRAIELSINASLSSFSASEISNYRSLAIFPEDQDAPLVTIVKLWRIDSQLDEIGAQRLARKLCKYSLISLNLSDQTVRLHDVMRKYLAKISTFEFLQERHRLLAQLYDDSEKRRDLNCAERKYIYRYLPMHASMCGSIEMVDNLLLDAEWLQGVQRETKSTHNIGQTLWNFSSLSNESVHNEYRPLEHLVEALYEVGHSLDRDPDQILPQILFRLSDNDGSEIEELRKCAQRAIRGPAIVPLWPSAHIKRKRFKPTLSFGWDAQEHLSRSPAMHGVTFLNAETAICSNRRGVLEIRSLKNGRPLKFLDALGGYFDVLLVINETQLVLSSKHGFVDILDLNRNELVKVVDPEAHFPLSICEVGNSLLALGCDNGDIVIVDIATAEVDSVLRGHSSRVFAVVTSGHGRLISGCEDGVIKKWDILGQKWEGSPIDVVSGVASLSAVKNNLLLVGTTNGTSIIIDVSSDEMLLSIELRQGVRIIHQGWITSSCVVAVTSIGEILLLDTHRKAIVARLNRDDRLGQMNFTVAASSPNGRSLLVGDNDGNLHAFTVLLIGEGLNVSQLL